MDRLTINSAGNLGADYQGMSNLKRRQPQAEEEEFANLLGTGQSESKSATSSETQDVPASAPASAVAKDLAENLPPLNRQQARQVLEELTPAIVQSHAWKLAEIQPVAERSLIPSAYV